MDIEDMYNEFLIVEPIKSTRYGWVKDRIDNRDKLLQNNNDTSLPRNFSLREKMPPVINQGKLGSCTANAIANAILYCEMIEKIDNKPRSRLFIYYNERMLENSVDVDSGAQMRDGIKTINSQGVCSEDSWPYDISKFTIKPPDTCYTEAKTHKVIKYRKVNQTVNDIKKALYRGFPIIFGFIVYDSIEKPTVTKSGIIPLPNSENKEIGGHAIICVGWDDVRRLFIIQNSWGIEWGDKGFGYISYDYLSNTNLASDFWVLEFTN